MIGITQVLLVIIAVLLFGLVITIHEFGHFFTAKLCGIRVNEFAVGMGPQIVSFQKGDTLYSLRLLPIGGYCAMEGEQEDSSDERAFNRKPVWKRILVVCMGAVMNIVLGLILMVIVLLQMPLMGSNVVARFEENSALQAAGIQVGDVITSIDGYTVRTDRDLQFALAILDTSGSEVLADFTVDREGQTLRFPDVKLNTVQAEDGTKSIIFDFKVMAIPKTFGTVLQKAVEDTISIVRLVWQSLFMLVTGQFGLNDLAGPVGTASAITQAASTGLESNGFAGALSNIVYIIMVITVNLGIMNLLPIPALDGGRLLFLLIEAVVRRPIPRRFEGIVTAAGFIFLMAVMVLVTFSDILRLFTGQGLGA